MLGFLHINQEPKKGKAAVQGPCPIRFRSMPLVIAGALLVLSASSSLFGSAIAAPESSTTESPQLLYNPPKHFVPRARVGGGLRGTDGSDPEVVALVPDHVGFTTHKTPVLNWFLSKPTKYEVRFTLVDNRSIRPTHESLIPTPKEAGVHTINLKELGVVLDPDIQYRWYVSVIRNHDSFAEDIVAGGVIERCEFSECVMVQGAHLTCDLKGIEENAKNGMWYDAMGCLCNMIEANPKDPNLRRMRAQLLKQVGLVKVAEWDLLSIAAAAH